MDQKITIKTINKHNGIEVTISDMGKGLSKEQSKLVFDQFYRVPTGSIHDVKGFGLGLYYVKVILIKLKGMIKVISKTIVIIYK